MHGNPNTSYILLPPHSCHLTTLFEIMEFKPKYAYVFDERFIIKNELGKLIQLIGGMMDITDKKIFQENLTLKTTQLREYSYFNSHKFRGPLARLMSLAHVLDIDEETTDSNRLVAKQIQVAAEELDRLVKELSKLLQ